MIERESERERVRERHTQTERERERESERERWKERCVGGRARKHEYAMVQKHAVAAIAQLAARRSHNPKVVSSILTRRIFKMIPKSRICGLQERHSQQKSSLQRQKYDPGRTRTCNLWFRRPTPYPLGHRARCNGWRVQNRRTCHKHERRVTMNRK